MSELSLWRQNPSSLLDSWDSWTKEMDRLLGGVERGENYLRQPACDISETDNGFVIEFDMPGVNRDEIDIQVEGKQLIVNAIRKRDDDIRKENFHRVERHYGEFRRVFNLHDNIDADKIEAEYSDGVLTLALPKVEVAKAKKIKIGSKPAGFLKRLVTEKNDKAHAANS